MTYLHFFELLIYFLAVAAWILWIRHRKNDRELFCALCIFGFLLEIMTITYTGSYAYGDFRVQIGGVPLCIGVAWGLLIFSAMHTSDAHGLPGWSRPFLDGLLVLSVDIGLDPVAVRLGFWNWSPAADHVILHGIPLGNYFAWLLAPFAISAAWRMLPIQAGRSLVAIPLALGVVVSGLSLKHIPLSSGLQWSVLVIPILVAFAVVIIPTRHRCVPSRRELTAILTPSALYGVGLAGLFHLGIPREAPVLFGLAFLSSVLGLTLHVLPHSFPRKYVVKGKNSQQTGAPLSSVKKS